MENENRPFARLADFLRGGLEKYVRFMGDIYGGEAAAKAAEIAALEHAYRISPDSTETTERTP
nr:hypothetical protein GA0070616_2371 [uncultured bacterium]AXL05995.1 hypothetical protein GA0070616_2371 [uncultured bacterium]